MEADLPLRPRGQDRPQTDRRRTTPSDRKSRPFPPNVAALDERLQRLERLATAGAVAANLAHEIKNAMVAVRTFVEMLLVRHQDTELAGIVKRELLRIDSIVAQLLRLAADPRPTLAEVHLEEVLERSLRLIEPQLATRSIHLTRNFRARIDLLEADSHRLEQAFTNLFLNAIEAIGRDGELAITTGPAPQPNAKPNAKKRVTSKERMPPQASVPGIRIAISDSGRGIPRENLPFLFEPFFTTKPDGTGLGLPITREIVHQHGGTISVQSSEGKGTTFSINLPVISHGNSSPIQS